MRAEIVADNAVASCLVASDIDADLIAGNDIAFLRCRATDDVTFASSDNDAERISQSGSTADICADIVAENPVCRRYSDKPCYQKNTRIPIARNDIAFLRRRSADNIVRSAANRDAIVTVS